MSKLARSRPSHGSRVRRESSFTPVERELRDGYIEVGLRGISLRRVADVYAVMLGGAWASTLSGVRSLLRPAASSEV